jgi:hypothetical protein
VGLRRYPMLWLLCRRVGVLGNARLPTKTLGSCNQLAGKLCSSSRVSDQVARTSWGASVGCFPLVGLLANILSTCNHRFITYFHLFLISSSVAGSPSQEITWLFRNFQIRYVDSDIKIRYSRCVPCFCFFLSLRKSARPQPNIVPSDTAGHWVFFKPQGPGSFPYYLLSRTSAPNLRVLYVLVLFINGTRFLSS